MKVILDVVDTFSPKENDIIVYDSKLKCWRTINKSVYESNIGVELSKIREDIDTREKNLKEIISELDKKIELAKESIRDLVEVIEEKGDL